MGLLLVSGPQAWSWLPVLVAFGWIFVLRGGFAWPRRSSWIWFGAALVLGASGLLARLDAVAAVGTSLTAWLAQWSGDFGAGNDLFALNSGWPWLRLLIDQPFLTVFGVVGLVLLATGRGLPRGAVGGPLRSRRREPMTSRLPRQSAGRGGWRCFWGCGWRGVWCWCCCRGGRRLCCRWWGCRWRLRRERRIAYLVALPLGDVNGLEVAVLLGVATVLVIAGSVWLAMVVESFTYDTRLVLTAAMLIGLLVLIWVVFGFWAGWQAAGKLAGLFFAALLLLVSVRSGWMLSHLGGQMSPNGFLPGDDAARGAAAAARRPAHQQPAQP